MFVGGCQKTFFLKAAFKLASLKHLLHKSLKDDLKICNSSILNIREGIHSLNFKISNLTKIKVRNWILFKKNKKTWRKIGKVRNSKGINRINA